MPNDYYLFRAPDNSMSPRYQAGDPVIFSAAQEPTENDEAVLQIRVDDCLNRNTVARIAWMDETHIGLQTHNPSETTSIPRADIIAMHRVVPLAEYLA